MTALHAFLLIGFGSWESLGPVVWAGGLVLFTCFLFLLLSRTPPSEPMRKCVLLSLAAHALLALYATTVPLIPILDLSRLTSAFSEERIAITRIESFSASAAGEPGEDAPGAGANQSRKSAAAWDELAESEPPRATPDPLPRAETAPAPVVARHELRPASLEPLRPLSGFSASEAASADAESTLPSVESEPAATAEPASVKADDAPKPESQLAEAAPTQPSEDAEPQTAPATSKTIQPEPLSNPFEPQPAPADLATRPTAEPVAPPPTEAPSVPVSRPSAADLGGAVAAPAMVAGATVGSTEITAEALAAAGAGASLARTARDPDAASLSPPLASAPTLPPLMPGAHVPLERRSRTTANDVPDVYKLRMEPKRADLIEELGGSTETEAAVNSALAWLAEAQSHDGRWDALRYGAGQERNVNGRDRNGAGARSDCGVTGLALLAFLGAGQTHQAGEHRAVVRKGVEFLVSRQTADGCLAGDATFYEFMYCHAMAAFALSECWALTGDPALEGPVRRAVSYTLRAQDARGGSWRYRPGDPGDTSVLGWQIMALESAEVGGVPIPRSAREGVQRYLSSVAQGRFGGLSGYRPGEPATRTMTAEALVCKQFLGIPVSEAAQREAADFLLSELPGQGEVNDYYWYYGSLALHERGGPDWDRWNEELQRTLVGRQRQDGSMAGSWDPRGVWGGHGGRVYSTAVAVLCLEVYYRYQHKAPAPDRAAGRDAERIR
ncbi:MAG TPA: hypothetical protein VGE52_13965 [Pirellulales bacterium]